MTIGPPGGTPSKPSEPPPSQKGDSTRQATRGAPPLPPEINDGSFGRKSNPEVKIERRYDAGHSDKLLAQDGRKIQLGDRSYRIKEWGSPRTLRTTYFDTPDLKLFKQEHELRMRGKVAGGRMSKCSLEATMLSGKGPQGPVRERIKGAQFKSADDWSTQRPSLLGSDIDPAVSAVRQHVEGKLQCTAVKTKTRRHFFVYPSGFPPVGPLKTRFVISVDDVSARGLRGNAKTARWKEVEVQIFTKLPWNRITPQIRQEFEHLCHWLETEMGLALNDASAYQDTIHRLGLDRGQQAAS